MPHDSTWVKNLNMMNMKKLTEEEEFRIREIMEEKEVTGQKLLNALAIV